MKKTVKMAICTAVIASANIFAPAMSVDNIALSIIAPTNVAYATISNENATNIQNALNAIAVAAGLDEDYYQYDANSGDYGMVKTKNNNGEYSNSRKLTYVLEDNVSRLNQYGWLDRMEYGSAPIDSANLRKVLKTAYESAGLTAPLSLTAPSIATDAQTRVGTLENTVSDLQTEVGTKANTSDVYTKSAVDDKLNQKANTSDVYTKSAVDDKLNQKANTSDVYSKDAVDDKLNQKANTSDVYTKSAVDDKLNQKANTNDVYTKSAVDDKLNQKANTSDVYSKTESDGRYASKTGLSDEIARSTAKDVQHDVKLANHETRISANTMAIANEEAERKSEVRRIDGRIDTETATRELVDQFLYDNIVEEANMRKNANVALNNKIDREVSRLDNRIDEVQSEARKGVAMAVATANLRMPSYDELHKWGAAIGGGYYKGMNAISVGVFYQFNRNMNFSLSVAQCGGDFTIGYGYSVKL